MASFLQRMILIALIFAIALPISMGHREKSKRHHRERSENESDDVDDSDDGEDDSDAGNYGSDDSEVGNYLRDLCSETNKPKQCWKIIKPEINRFSDTDSRNVAGVVIDLAIAKLGEINDQLNQLHDDSGDDKLKEKYNSCSKNYEDANRKLQSAKGNLDSDDCRKIPDQIDDAAQELKSCKHQFGKKSSDPAHIRNRNKEFGRYVEIVKVAANRFLKEKDGDIDRKT